MYDHDLYFENRNHTESVLGEARQHRSSGSKPCHDVVTPVPLKKKKRISKQALKSFPLFKN